MKTLRIYYELTKPGIVYGNAIAAVGGFFLASAGVWNAGLFASMLVGLSLVVASACIFNNYADRSMDRRMERTKGRGFAEGSVSVPVALSYGVVLGLTGFWILFAFVNVLSAEVAFFGFMVYLFGYTPAKSRTPYAVHIGALAGAVPPVVGYVAVTGAFDLGALLFFFLLFFWQIPHFVAIAIRRADEYRAAGVPALPLVRSVRATRSLMRGYVIAFIVVGALFYVAGYAGEWYLLLLALFGGWWLALTLRAPAEHEEKKWAKRVFIFSLFTLLGVLIGLAANPLTPHPEEPIVLTAHS